MKDDDSGGNPGPTDLYLVSETSTGKAMVVNGRTGEFDGEICLSEIHAEVCGEDVSTLARPCLMFGLTHSLVDDTDQLLMTYTLRNPDVPFAPGAIANITIDHPPVLNWFIDTLTIPVALQNREGLDCESLPDTPGCHLYGSHNTIELADERLLVADTSNSRILWLIPPTEGSAAVVDDVLSFNHPEWKSERYPNQVQALSFDDREFLLITFKGSIDEDENPTNFGSIVLWEITDPAHFTRVWTYPETGYLSAVHQGLVQETPEGNILLYAHSYGAADPDEIQQDGSIGFARFRGIEPPQYMADGISAEPGFGFTREVEWDASRAQIIVTDSGCENSQVDCLREGRILSVHMPELEEAGTSGAYTDDHEHQRFIELETRRNIVKPSIQVPFDTDRVAVDNQGSALRDGAGSCP